MGLSSRKRGFELVHSICNIDKIKKMTVLKKPIVDT